MSKQAIQRCTYIGWAFAILLSAYAVPHRLIERYHDWLAICDQIPEPHNYVAGVGK